MNVEFRKKWYDFSEYYGVNVEKLSNEWFKYRWKHNSYPELSVLHEYANLTKELDDDEYSFLYAMCRGSHAVESFKKRPLKRIIESSGKKPIFYIPSHRSKKTQKTLRVENYKLKFLQDKLKKDFSNCIYDIFDFWVEKQGFKEELFDYYKKDYYGG